MNNKPEPRKDFYAPGLNMDRVYYWVEELARNCSFEEICKIFREIAWDQVRYNSEKDCSIIYKSDQYSETVREQANRFYNQARTICDLFAQCISDKRAFDESYLSNYDFAGPYKNTIEQLKDRISELEDEVSYYKNIDRGVD